ATSFKRSWAARRASSTGRARNTAGSTEAPGASLPPRVRRRSRAARRALELWGDRLRRFPRGDDGDDFKFHKVFPSGRPLLQEARVVALHQLKAPAELRLDPALHVAQPLRRHPPALPVTPVHRG